MQHSYLSTKTIMAMESKSTMRDNIGLYPIVEITELKPWAEIDNFFAMAISI